MTLSLRYTTSTTTTLQSNSPHPYTNQFCTKIQYGFLPLSFDMQKKEPVPAFSFFTPNNIQSWPQKHKFFFLLFPLKQEKQLENVVSESLVMSVPM